MCPISDTGSRHNNTQQPNLYSLTGTAVLNKVPKQIKEEKYRITLKQHPDKILQRNAN